MNILIKSLTLLVVVHYSHGWGSSPGKKVLLTNVQALTLRENVMTEGRRSSPVPQLLCLDQGSASCSSFRPKMVQCLNKGSDGMDIQWECQSDMDRSLKFGSIEVSCEGYDYPEDAYILAGSCGLRYSLDYTKDNHQGHSNHQERQSKTGGFLNNIADLIVYAGIGLMIYALYVSCARGYNEARQDDSSHTDDDYPTGGTGGGYGWFGGQNPPGSTHQQTYDTGSCRNRGTQRGGGGGGAGFWTGAATGGLLGYMFGGRGYGGRGGYAPSYGSGFGSSGGFGSSSGGSTSSGTYTSSGFGGTSRR